MKNLDKRRKFRQAAFTLLGILFVGALFCLAVTFPTYYSILYDKNTLNKINYTDIKINTYETSYETFPEKIRSFAQAYTENGKIHAIRISGPENWMGKQELTAIANRELETIRNNSMTRAIQDEEIKLKEKKLSAFERYTIYQTQGEDDLQGISFWKLIYKMAKKTVTLYLDEEFHKIYYLDIMYKHKAVSKAATAYTPYDYDTLETSFYEWWEGLRHYYGIDTYELQNSKSSVYSWAAYDNFQGSLEFDGKYMISFYERFYDENKAKHWIMGMPIEEMIQF